MSKISWNPPLKQSPIPKKKKLTIIDLHSIYVGLNWFCRNFIPIVKALSAKHRKKLRSNFQKEAMMRENIRLSNSTKVQCNSNNHASTKGQCSKNKRIEGDLSGGKLTMHILTCLHEINYNSPKPNMPTSNFCSA